MIQSERPMKRKSVPSAVGGSVEVEKVGNNNSIGLVVKRVIGDFN